MQIFVDSLSTAIFGIAVVFAVLVGLIVLIKVLNMAVAAAARRKKEPEIESVLAVEVPSATPVVAAALAYPPQALRLTDVDERTAAIIMAIVCDEIGVPVNELYFKSIRLLKDQVPAQNEGV